MEVWLCVSTTLDVSGFPIGVVPSMDVGVSETSGIVNMVVIPTNCIHGIDLYSIVTII